MNRQNNHASRRGKRMTGQFYLLMILLVVLLVFIGVLVAGRARDSAAYTPAPSPTVEPAPTQIERSDGDVGALDELIQNDGDLTPLVVDSDIDVNAVSVTPGLPGEWRNILLLGSDTRNLDSISRTDTIIIASINVNNGRVKLTSVMRDLIVPYGADNVRINSLPHYGGIELLVKTINELFGMNITEYVLVNFASFQKVIDNLPGGTIRMNVTQAEMGEINKSLGEQAKLAGMSQEEYLRRKEALSLKVFGQDTPLTGIQALSFCRIRKIDSDYRRVERQRDMLNAILKKMKNDANPVQLMQIAGSIWGDFKTNMDMLSAVSIATTVIKNGATQIDSDGRIPANDTYVSDTRGKTTKVTALWDCDFAANRQKLYQFIYEQ